MIQDHHNGIICTADYTWVERICDIWNIRRTPRRKERIEAGSVPTDIYSKARRGPGARSSRALWPY